MAGVDEPDNGTFKITKGQLTPLPAGISNDPVKFVCADSSGSNLVTMSDSKVGGVTLPGGGSVQTAITDADAISNCFSSGKIHLSSSELVNYYSIGSDGRGRKFKFYEGSIKSSTGCIFNGDLGYLCTSGLQISFSTTCTGTPISGLVSGFVGVTNAYLFDDSNVYVFSSNAFTGQSVLLTKKDSKSAWLGKPSTSKPDDNPNPPDNSKCTFQLSSNQLHL